MSPNWFVTLIALLNVASVAMVYSEPIQIAYHRYALERLHQETFGEPPENFGGFLGYELDVERQDYHCQRLVDLGYFFHERYEMENVPDTREAHRELWGRLVSKFPDRRYVGLGYINNELDVWDLAESKSEWDAFVEEHNVTDFVERFVTPSEETERSEEPDQENDSD